MCFIQQRDRSVPMPCALQLLLLLQGQVLLLLLLLLHGQVLLLLLLLLLPMKQWGGGLLAYNSVATATVAAWDMQLLHNRKQSRRCRLTHRLHLRSSSKRGNNAD